MKLRYSIWQIMNREASKNQNAEAREAALVLVVHYCCSLMPRQAIITLAPRISTCTHAVQFVVVVTKLCPVRLAMSL